MLEFIWDAFKIGLCIGLYLFVGIFVSASWLVSWENTKLVARKNESSDEFLMGLFWPLSPLIGLVRVRAAAEEYTKSNDVNKSLEALSYEEVYKIVKLHKGSLDTHRTCFSLSHTRLSSENFGITFCCKTAEDADKVYALYREQEKTAKEASDAEKKKATREKVDKLAGVINDDIENYIVEAMKRR